MKWTAGLVLDALREAYLGVDGGLSDEEWSMLTEVPLRSAGSVNHYTSNTRTIDALLVRNWTSGVGHRRIAVEVKVSRSDYRNETPAKREPAEHAAHQTVYAAPAGLIAPATLPAGWGLIEVHDTRGAAARATGHPLGPRCRVRVRPAPRSPVCDLDYLVAATTRRASRAEEKIRAGADDAVVPALREEVERLAGMLYRRDQALTRTQDRLRAARAQVAAVAGPQVCADCGQPVRFTVNATWAHVEETVGRACERARAEAHRARRQAETGTAYLLGWADPVETATMRATRDAEGATTPLSGVHSDS